jgi:hypothetical protein
MQNCYVGDVGDFGKYGLLRALCQPASDGNRSLSLGVVWYLVPDEGHNADGKHTRFLRLAPVNAAEYRDCDPFLYDSLREIVDGKARHVASIRESGILPAGTVFFEEPLTFGGMPHIGPAAREARLRLRTDWLQRALAATVECDVVFVDPDNGLEVKTQRHARRGPKHVFFDELVPYLRRGQSLVIYHHMARTGSAPEQIQERLAEIEERLTRCDTPFALHYHRGTSRAFFVVPTNAHRVILLGRADRFVAGPWSEHEHFSLVHPKSR